MEKNSIEKTVKTNADYIMGAVFLFCTGIGWLNSQLIGGAILGIALGLIAMFAYKSYSKTTK